MKGNVLEIRNIEEDSEWTDKDSVMFHACFTLLCDFVEIELPSTENMTFEAWVEWCEGLEGDFNHAEGQRALLELYEWYVSVDWDQNFAILSDPIDESGETYRDKMKELVKHADLLWT